MDCKTSFDIELKKNKLNISELKDLKCFKNSFIKKLKTKPDVNFIRKIIEELDNFCNLHKKTVYVLEEKKISKKMCSLNYSSDTLFNMVSIILNIPTVIIKIIIDYSHGKRYDISQLSKLDIIGCAHPKQHTFTW